MGRVTSRPRWVRVFRAGCLTTLLYAGAVAGRAASHDAAPLPSSHPQAYGGESCVLCHTAAKPAEPVAPEESFDVVIVGGGMAGMSTLHYLPDRKVVLLEAEMEAGGQMRADTWNGIKFSKGAAYFVEPYGVLKEFYDSEKIPMRKIPPPENSAWIDGKYYPDCWTREGREKMPWTGPAKEAWLKWLSEMEEVNNTNRSNQPFDTFDPEQRKLDGMTTKEWLTENGLSPDMISHFDLYIPSCFGETSGTISASAFSNYLSGELGGNFTLEGGMGGVTQIIYGNHKDKIRLGCRVTKVVQNMDEARVTYQDQAGKAHTLRARTVVVALPGNLVPGIVPDLPEEKKQIIENTQYSAYLVAAVLCKEVLWDDKGYDTWIKGMFFKDIIDATWISRGGKPYANKKQPHVLSLYIPLGVPGVQKITYTDPEVYKERILTDLEKVIPGSRSKVEGIRLYRWGHSMHIAKPGFLMKSIPILRRPFYRIFFAGAEVEGLPCNESAILSGYSAARGVQTWLWNAPPASLPKDKN
jgi:protoporphyrinogen oxidase